MVILLRHRPRSVNHYRGKWRPGGYRRATRSLCARWLRMRGPHYDQRLGHTIAQVAACRSHSGSGPGHVGQRHEHAPPLTPRPSQVTSVRNAASQGAGLEWLDVESSGWRGFARRERSATSSSARCQRVGHYGSGHDRRSRARRHMDGNFRARGHRSQRQRH